MTIKLNSLARWSLLPVDQAIAFEGSDVAERRVRIDFNLEAVTAFFIGDDTGESFLCTIGPGLETVEFNVSGSFKVYAEKGSATVHYQSADLEPTFAEIIDPKIFTKIANRRHRNPEYEEMMYKMQLNIERRLASQAAELEGAFARRIAEMENGRPAEIVVSDAPGAAASGAANEVSAQGAGGEIESPPASKPDGGKPAGDGGNGGS